MRAFAYAATDPADQRRLQEGAYRTLAKLHAIDWRAAGLDVLHDPRHGRLGLDEQLGFYEYFLDWGRMGRPQVALDRVAAWLRANQPDPEPEPVLNWGDSRIGNLLFLDHTPVAVLDWEMATLGPREVDLAWMLLFERFFSSHLGVDNEHVYWPTGRAPRGTFSVRVAHFESCISGRPVDYRITVRNCGETVVLSGRFQGMAQSQSCLSAGQDPSWCQDVVSFVVPPCSAPNGP